MTVSVWNSRPELVGLAYCGVSSSFALFYGRRQTILRRKIAVNSRRSGSQPFDMTFHVLFRQALAEQDETADDFAD